MVHWQAVERNGFKPMNWANAGRARWKSSLEELAGRDYKFTITDVPLSVCAF